MDSARFDPATIDLEPSSTDPARLTAGTEIRARRLWHRDDGSEAAAVWEMTPGTLRGVKGDESFVVLSGRGRIDFPDGRVLEFKTGDAVVIAPGDVCDFTVIETVRKVVVIRLA
jgi:uncharacterized cupin superfamily protein